MASASRDDLGIFDPCGVSRHADLPWPLSLKLMPDPDVESRDKAVEAENANAAPQGKLRWCQAWFRYKNGRKLLRWQGPQGGSTLLDAVRETYTIPNDKLIYLVDCRSRDIIDIDSALAENIDYEVKVEPEDTGPLNIVPCLFNLCTFRYGMDEPRKHAIGQ